MEYDQMCAWSPFLTHCERVTNKGVTWGHFENASYDVVHFPSERRYYGFKSRNIFVLEIWGQTGSKIEFFWIFLKMTLTIWLIFLLKADIIGSDQETRRWGNTMIFLEVMKMQMTELTFKILLRLHFVVYTFEASCI